MMCHRTVLLFRLLVFPLMLMQPLVHAQPAQPVIKPLTDLRDAAQRAADEQIPILLLFSTESCEFCALIKQDYLGPMSRNPAYEHRVMIREVPAVDYHYLRDFDGELIGGDDLALRYDADLIPTIVLIDSRGRVLTEPMVGFISRHYYDRTLDANIQQALEKIGSANERK